MSWMSTLPGATVAWAAAIALALTVLAYIIKTRRRRFEVPFSSLWKRVLEQRDANSLFKQLKRLLSLLLALAILPWCSWPCSARPSACAITGPGPWSCCSTPRRR